LINSTLEKVSSIILYSLRVFQDGVQEAGREWNLTGILGTEWERKGL